ncbi:MAG: GNAT family N-acetyltransferase [Exiguobacterium sp.]|nr:GNAT family N-acetyltransferase [Exiguobacterium sp.]MBR2757313.1 GNAT family N-acetyltransferase [Exiguobacterium sp.]MBR3216781.1 GNAT family N-acetyltransferase [Exiguobacterium sp.]
MTHIDKDGDIEETYRGQGYATAVFEKLERVVSEKLGTTSIGLSVFGTKPDAQRLYKRLGSQETSIAMNKQL